MVEFSKFESKMIRMVRRNLLNVHDAIIECQGYLNCLSDLGVISEDRCSEEVGLMTKLFLEIEKDM